MYFMYIHTHLLHYLHTITETEDNTFLCCTHQVGFAMLVEIYAMDRATDLFILKHTLSSIAKRNDCYTITSNRNTCHHIIHI